MKQLRPIGSALVASLIVVSCGGGDDASDVTDPSSPAAAATGAPSSSVGRSTVGGEPVAADPVDAAKGGTFRWGTTTIPATMDPSLAGSDAHVAYFLPVYENLIRADAGGELVPGLAEEWSLSNDGLTFDLTLRAGVTFHDGTPVDAAAVVANIEHSKAEGSLLAPVLAVVDTAEAIDETNVRFTLTRPGGDLPEILRGYAGMMASPASIAGGTLSTEPVGAGPFTVTAITDTTVTYERWDDYWDADSIQLDGMEVTVMTDDIARLNALRSGQLDGTFIRPNQAAEAEAAGLLTETGPRVFTYGIYLNPASPEFADPDVRRAISLAVDRPSIESFLYDDRCTPAAQLFPPEYWAYNNEIDDEAYMAYDPEAARALLAEAAPDGLRFTLTTATITNYQRLAEVLQDQLGQIGVEVEVEAIDSNDLAARVRAGEYSATVSALYAANPDPAAYAAQYYVAGPGSTEYIVPELEASVEASRLTIDRHERADAIGEISAEVLDAGTPIVAVCIPDIVFAYRDGVSGLQVPLLGNYDFRDVAVAG